METCTVEVGLLKKRPCGHPSVTRCQNCEQPLCKDHAVALTSAGRKTGKFMCKQCHASWTEYEQNAAPPPAPKKEAPATAPKAEAKKPEEKKPEDNGGLDFEPSKK